MVTLEEYFRDSVARGHEPTKDETDNALALLVKVNALFTHLGVDPPLTSGHRTREKKLELRAQGYGAALGGTHESGEGGDWADEDGEIDDSITDELLERFGLYREHPAATRRWAHLQTRSPRSGRRSFYP